MLIWPAGAFSSHVSSTQSPLAACSPHWTHSRWWCPPASASWGRSTPYLWGQSFDLGSRREEESWGGLDWICRIARCSAMAYWNSSAYNKNQNMQILTAQPLRLFSLITSVCLYPGQRRWWWLQIWLCRQQSEGSHKQRSWGRKLQRPQTQPGWRWTAASRNGGRTFDREGERETGWVTFTSFWGRTVTYPPVCHGAEHHSPHQQAEHVDGWTQAVEAGVVTHQVPLKQRGHAGLTEGCVHWFEFWRYLLKNAVTELLIGNCNIIHNLTLLVLMVLKAPAAGMFAPPSLSLSLWCNWIITRHSDGYAGKRIRNLSASKIFITNPLIYRRRKDTIILF